jgi:hypothetical protein
MHILYSALDLFSTVYIQANCISYIGNFVLFSQVAWVVDYVVLIALARGSKAYH